MLGITRMDSEFGLSATLNNLSEGREEWVNISPTIRSTFKQVFQDLASSNKRNVDLERRVQELQTELEQESELRQSMTAKFETAMQTWERQFKENLERQQSQTQQRLSSIESSLARKADSSYVTDALLVKANKSDLGGVKDTSPWESSMLQWSKLEGTIARLGGLELKVEQYIQDQNCTARQPSEECTDPISLATMRKLQDGLASLARAMHKKANKNDVTGAFDFLESSVQKLNTKVDNLQSETQSKLHVMAYNTQQLQHQHATSEPANHGAQIQMSNKVERLTLSVDELLESRASVSQQLQQLLVHNTELDSTVHKLELELQSIKNKPTHQTTNNQPQDGELFSEVEACRQLARGAVEKSVVQNTRIETLQEEYRKLSLDFANVKHSLRMLESQIRLQDQTQQVHKVARTGNATVDVAYSTGHGKDSPAISIVGVQHSTDLEKDSSAIGNGRGQQNQMQARPTSVTPSTALAKSTGASKQQQERSPNHHISKQPSKIVTSPHTRQKVHPASSLQPESTPGSRVIQYPSPTSRSVAPPQLPLSRGYVPDKQSQGRGSRIGKGANPQSRTGPPIQTPNRTVAPRQPSFSRSSNTSPEDTANRSPRIVPLQQPGPQVVQHTPLSLDGTPIINRGRTPSPQSHAGAKSYSGGAVQTTQNFRGIRNQRLRVTKPRKKV